MTDQDKKKEVPIPEKEVVATDQIKRFEREPGKVPETKEALRDDKLVSAELRKEIEMMQLDDSTKAEAEKKAQKIEFLGEKEKIEHLLEIAREKGVVFAIQVAKRMNEPYLLDILHDTLAREGFYLKMGQPNDNDDNKT